MNIFRLCKITIILVISTMILSGCSLPSQPKDINNICSMVNQYPDWYYWSKDTQKRWKVPVAVQFALIRQESKFIADAKPQKYYWLNLIPWGRVTSAYGYAQALDGTWKHYIDATGQYTARRDNFKAASDFIGWYSNYIHSVTGISYNNAYELYLAYHEGPGGYNKKSYLSKKWLVDIAKNKVQRWANTYSKQLRTCQIPQRSWWSSWFS